MPACCVYGPAKSIHSSLNGKAGSPHHVHMHKLAFDMGIFTYLYVQCTHIHLPLYNIVYKCSPMAELLSNSTNPHKNVVAYQLDKALVSVSE